MGMKGCCEAQNVCDKWMMVQKCANEGQLSAGWCCGVMSQSEW